MAFTPMLSHKNHDIFLAYANLTRNPMLPSCKRVRVPVGSFFDCSYMSNSREAFPKKEPELPLVRIGSRGFGFLAMF